MANAVQSLCRPSKEEFYDKSCALTQPIVVKEAVKEWDAVSSWNVEFMRNRFGHLLVKVNWSTDCVFRGDPETGFSNYEEMRFDRFLDLTTGKLKATRRYYLTTFPFKGEFSTLLKDIQIPDYIDRKRHTWTHLWLGAAGTVSSLHYDYMDNLLGQVCGMKRFVLFAPDQSDCLYPFPTTSQIPFLGQVDIDNPDYDKFPRLKDARSMEAILNPGDMIFIPLNWWHQVYSLSMSTSVNFWYPLPQP